MSEIHPRLHREPVEGACPELSEFEGASLDTAPAGPTRDEGWWISIPFTLTLSSPGFNPGRIEGRSAG